MAGYIFAKTNHYFIKKKNDVFSERRLTMVKAILFQFLYFGYEFVFYCFSTHNIRKRVFFFIILFIFSYNRIFAVTFDENFAKASGMNTRLYNMIFALSTMRRILTYRP